MGRLVSGIDPRLPGIQKAESNFQRKSPLHWQGWKRGTIYAMASSFQFMSQRSQWDGECEHLQNRDGARPGLPPRKYKSTLNAMPLSLPFYLWKDHLAITHLETDSAPSRCIIVEPGSEKSLARSSCCVTWAVSASETCPVHPCHQDLQLLSHQWHCEMSQCAEAALQCLWKRQSVADTQVFLSPKGDSFRSLTPLSLFLN